jgi:hypothetical protein
MRSFAGHRKQKGAGMTSSRDRNRLTAGLVLLAALAAPLPGQAQNALEPRYAGSRIQCPDGSTRDIAGPGEPDKMVMRIACSTVALGAAAPKPGPSHDVVDGRVRCEDGTTRPMSGTSASDLAVRMICLTPGDPERDREIQEAVDRKNHDANMRAALSGQKGVWEGLKASWEARSFDYVLRFPLVLAAMAGLALLLLSRLFKRG